MEKASVTPQDKEAKERRKRAEALGLTIESEISSIRNQAENGGRASSHGVDTSGSYWHRNSWENYIEAKVRRLQKNGFTPEEIERFKEVAEQISQHKKDEGLFIDEKKS